MIGKPSHCFFFVLVQHKLFLLIIFNCIHILLIDTRNSFLKKGRKCCMHVVVNLLGIFYHISFWKIDSNERVLTMILNKQNEKLSKSLLFFNCREFANIIYICIYLAALGAGHTCFNPISEERRPRSPTRPGERGSSSRDDVGMLRSNTSLTNSII